VTTFELWKYAGSPIDVTSNIDSIGMPVVKFAIAAWKSPNEGDPDPCDPGTANVELGEDSLNTSRSSFKLAAPVGDVWV
jgi:hypothetical protein